MVEVKTPSRGQNSGIPGERTRPDSFRKSLLERPSASIQHRVSSRQASGCSPEDAVCAGLGDCWNPVSERLPQNWWLRKVECVRLSGSQVEQTSPDMVWGQPSFSNGQQMLIPRSPGRGRLNPGKRDSGVYPVHKSCIPGGFLGPSSHKVCFSRDICWA